MPTHFSPKAPSGAINRRRFLKTGATLFAGWLLIRPSLFADAGAIDPNYYVLLADTHIDGDTTRVSSGINMAENLEKVVNRILEKRPFPAGVVLNGDAAFSAGYKEDYIAVKRLLEPLSKAGIPVYITMGNHDDRGPFFEVMHTMKAEDDFVDGRHILIVDTPNARFFLLDTLKIVNQRPGRLGAEQLQWLEKALRQYDDKPAILFGHHHYHLWDGTPGEGGLQDTKELWETIVPQKHVKAYFAGHTHRWGIAKTDGIHRINQPCTSYTWNRDDRTQAFIHARFHENHAELKLECFLDPDFEWHGRRYTLDYRPA